MSSSLVPRPRPAFRHLHYEKRHAQGESENEANCRTFVARPPNLDKLPHINSWFLLPTEEERKMCIMSNTHVTLFQHIKFIQDQYLGFCDSYQLHVKGAIITDISLTKS